MPVIQAKSAGFCYGVRRAVELVGGRMVTEASGRITPETAAAIAESGVDLISVGWLTHSARVLDIGLDHA